MVRIPPEYTVQDHSIFMFEKTDEYQWWHRIVKSDITKFTGKGVKVAVLDTGLKLNHKDLSNHILSKDFTGSGIQDMKGHGTHVRGIINMKHDDRGYIGVAPDCEIIIAKILDNSGIGTMGWMAEGIYWAVDNGADVINMSLGGGGKDRIVAQAIDYAESNNVVLVCASGNESRRIVGYPAAYDTCIAVGAIDRNANLAPFSNQGKAIDIVAPGIDILSTWIDGRHKLATGTSMATPIISGICALIVEKMRSENKIVTAKAVRRILYDSTKDLLKVGWDTKTGHGYGVCPTNQSLLKKMAKCLCKW